MYVARMCVSYHDEANDSPRAAAYIQDITPPNYVLGYLNYHHLTKQPVLSFSSVLLLSLIIKNSLKSIIKHSTTSDRLAS